MKAFRVIAVLLLCMSISYSAYSQTSSLQMQPGGVINVGGGALPADLAIADFNNDGKQDLAVAQAGLNSVAVYRQSSVGGFTVTPVTYALAASPGALVALNVDNALATDDLIVACSNYSNGGIFYALTNTNDPQGTLTLGPIQLFNGGAPGTSVHLATGYINNDNRPEVMFALETAPLTGLTVGTYVGSGGWTTTGRAVAGGAPAGILLEDINGDGFVDAVATTPGTNKVRVFEHTRLNVVNPYVSASYVDVPVLGVGPVDVATADVSRDSRPDLVTANAGDNTISVILTTGPMRFGTPVVMQQSSAPRKVLLADFNNDQLPDLVTINANNTINFYENTGQPGPSRYGTPLTLSTGLNPVAVKAGDFDGDRQLDVAVACAGDNTIRFYRNVSQPLATKSRKQLSVNVYPNPATDAIQAQLPTLPIGILEITLTDMAGRVALNQTLASSANFTIPVAGITRGMYILQVRTEKNTFTNRVTLR